MYVSMYISKSITHVIIIHSPPSHPLHSERRRKRHLIVLKVRHRLPLSPLREALLEYLVVDPIRGVVECYACGLIGIYVSD
jgi:hypothetical protein